MKSIEKKMAFQQSMMQAISHAAIEATKEAIMAARETEKPVVNARIVQQTPRVSGPILKKPTCDLKAPDKYHKLNNLN